MPVLQLLTPRRQSGFNRLLFAVCLAQAVAILGFDFAIPFIPLYLQQDMGVHGLGQIAIWSGIIGFGPAIPAAIFGPMWGRLADRYGYRFMLLRAMACAAIFLVLMGLAQTLWMLLALRMMQGALTGTIFASQALVASSAPEKETGRAMGMLQMSIYAGATMGPVLGGIVAQIAGYRAAFVMAGVLIGLATIVVFFFVTEPARVKRAEGEHRKPIPFLKLLAIPAFGGAVLFSVATQFVASSMFPIIPLFVQELLRGSGSTSVYTGWLLAVSGLSAAAGSYTAGRLHRSFGLVRPLLVLGSIAVALLFMQSFSQSYVGFLGLRSLSAFCLGGLFALVGAWAAATSPRDAKGAAFGLIGAASSFGFGAGPLIGGFVVSLAGIRSVFVMAGMVLAVAMLGCGLAKKQLFGWAGREAAPMRPSGEAIAAE